MAALADSFSEIAAALPDAAARRAVFVPGDRVVVISGDLVNLEGVVTKVDEGEGGLVHVRSVGGDGVDEVELPLAPSEIMKAFRVGDRVRVLSGPHKGEAGIVVKVERGVCAVVGDTTKAQFRVNARDLTEGVDTAPGNEVLGDKYQLHDLVQLDAQTAGVIVSVERGAARVLTNQGTAGAPDVRVCKVGEPGDGA
ncbi:Putative transcription elongation factor SPT5 like protein [Monoraphidium neglectum]|uniref:Putative transcription elongation factor SPT5 like protein n=1 Tax=Monoraphidium neglectum TaxID=145388 RepID=A0A0D2LSC8_9CHLO|nr:Putative transcription elongation factor SPT5 like protein [Monoraphidium neglectum]KIY92691.1 Putative transcription elongation factor SPT5 like protein [Monoraphidium neglectum]|eukprot:XP_013891711.1 Putative transcription elongation factor SPT5 like protein [Monoraphidium neglectum]